MRDPARIPMILAAIAKRWERDPDLRFGQLLSHLVGDDDVRMIEDGELLGRLGPASSAEREYVTDEPGRRRDAWKDFTRRQAPSDDQD